MQIEVHFDRIGVVAHIMGGLVSRGAILKYTADTKRDDVRLLLSISTPWDGAATAGGARDAPIELPASFADMSPSSDYLRWIFYEDVGRDVTKALPAHVDFHMFMGFRMSDSGKVADDSSVTLMSQARVEAQEEAASIRAWDYDHWEILKSPEAVARMNELLERRF